MSAFGPGKLFGPRSVTLVRQDQFPDLPPTAAAAARIAAFAKAVALTNSPTTFNKDKMRLDITTSQTHSLRFDITTNPVESKASITDNVRKLPEILQFDGWVIDHPLVPIVGLIPNRAHRQYQQLREFAEEQEPLFVATSIRAYDNMMIEQMDVLRTLDSGSGIQVRLTMREVQIRDLRLSDKAVSALAAGYGAAASAFVGTV